MLIVNKYLLSILPFEIYFVNRLFYLCWMLQVKKSPEEGEPLKEAEIYEIADKLSGLIPTFKRRFVRPLEQHIKYALTPMQMHVMTILSEKKYLSMTELSQETEMCKQQMTPLIDKLIDNGFVNREHDCTDRRSLKVSITPEGANLLKDIHQNVLKILKEKIEGLEQNDLEGLSKALDEFYRVFKKIH